jgi:hypothetical protein
MRIEAPGLVYISGPMTGYEEFNRPAFNEAREHLQNIGFSVIVPGDDEEYTIRERLAWKVTDTSRRAYMFRDFLHVLTANYVAVLDGWEESKGSKAEVLVAQEIGLPVFYWDTLEPVEEEVTTNALRTIGRATDNIIHGG